LGEDGGAWPARTDEKTLNLAADVGLLVVVVDEDESTGNRPPNLTGEEAEDDGDEEEEEEDDEEEEAEEGEEEDGKQLRGGIHREAMDSSDGAKPIYLLRKAQIPRNCRNAHNPPRNPRIVNPKTLES
jgi:hypothetical protein